MRNAPDGRITPQGTSLPPRDLSAEQLAMTDVLLIEELTDLDDESFGAALRS